MNILLIDDEVGIREGLAAFLRLKGHGVHTAGSSAEARDQPQNFDLVITDWRLADGSGDTVAGACGCPVIVVSACPEEVEGSPGLIAVLEKPVSPRRLLQEIETLEVRPDSERTRDLSKDTADRIALALALIGEPQTVEVSDEGAFVTVNVSVPALPDHAIAQLELIGGDLRVWGRRGALVVELRLCRDGRPEGARAPAAWPDWAGDPGGAVVDVGTDRPPDPSEFLAILDRAARARRQGHPVHLINIPSHLRLYAEISGRGHEVPKRTRAEPRLPEVLVRLWS